MSLPPDQSKKETGGILSTSFRAQQRRMSTTAVSDQKRPEESNVQKRVTPKIMTPFEARMLQSAESLKPLSEQDIDRGSFVAYAQRAAARNVRAGICAPEELKKKVENLVVVEIETEKQTGTVGESDNFANTGAKPHTDADTGTDTDVFTDAKEVLSHHHPEPKSQPQPDAKSVTEIVTHTDTGTTKSPPTNQKTATTKPSSAPGSGSRSSFKFGTGNIHDDDVDVTDAETLSPTLLKRAMASPIRGAQGGLGETKGTGTGGRSLSGGLFSYGNRAIVSPGTASGSGTRVSSASGGVIGGGKRIGSGGSGSGGGSPHGKGTGDGKGGPLMESPGNKRVVSGESAGNGVDGKDGDGKSGGEVVVKKKESPGWRRRS